MATPLLVMLAAAAGADGRAGRLLAPVAAEGLSKCDRVLQRCRHLGGSLPCPHWDSGSTRSSALWRSLCQHRLGWSHPRLAHRCRDQSRAHVFPVLSSKCAWQEHCADLSAASLSCHKNCLKLASRNIRSSARCAEQADTGFNICCCLCAQAQRCWMEARESQANASAAAAAKKRKRPGGERYSGWQRRRDAGAAVAAPAGGAQPVRGRGRVAISRKHS